MPTNLDALLRYHVIDACLQRHYQKWTWEALAEKCGEALNEHRDRVNYAIPSKRTIENDILVMKSDQLGYFAPIARKNNYYFYEDKNYSIKNCSLNQQDLRTLSLISKVLGQYKGLKLFSDFERIFSKIESKIFASIKDKVEQSIFFDTQGSEMGYQWLLKLLEAIEDKRALAITYQRFQKQASKVYFIHPYFLKEYKGVWYLMAWNEERAMVVTYALDRILSVDDYPKPYYKDAKPNPDLFFKNTIGIGKALNDVLKVIIRVQHPQDLYLKSAPLHKSQQLLQSTETYSDFRLDVVENYELHAALFALQEDVEILEPLELKLNMKQILDKMVERYKS
jgi:predicted DNA-binding transcriptional regulator YafY